MSDPLADYSGSRSRCARSYTGSLKKSEEIINKLLLCSSVSGRDGDEHQ